MDGIGGYSNWRWMFILEGIITLIVGISAFFFVADFPEDVTWLTEDERSWVIARTGRDTEPARNITTKDILRFFRKPKNLFGGIIYFSKHFGAGHGCHCTLTTCHTAMVVPIYSRRTPRASPQHPLSP